MKDLIAKLQMDANITLGAIWLHIDAQAARIAELEAQITAASAPVVGTEWKSLNDVQWMNIVNHDHAYFGWDKEDAVHHAVKATEAKLRELNVTALQAPVREVPEGWQLVPIVSTSKMDRAGEDAYESRGHCDCGNAHGVSMEMVYDAMLAAAPLPADPVQPEGE